MDERKLELKRLKKRSNQAKRKYTLLWSILRILSLLLALATTVASVCCVLLGGALSARYSGKLWEISEPDSNAVYFAETSDAAQTAEALRRQAVTEGAVLLVNQGVLPLEEGVELSKLSLGSGIVHCADTAIVYLKDGADGQWVTNALQQKAENQVKAVVLVLDTPAVTGTEFFPEVDACLWTGGMSDTEAVTALLTGKQNPSGALATAVYDSTGAEVYPFGYGLHYTEFTYSEMALHYDVATDRFTAMVTVTNTGNRAGKDTVQLSVRYGQEAQGESKLVAFGKTGLLEPGSSQILTLTPERRALASYDNTGEGGYVIAAGDYAFVINGAEQPPVGVYTQAETDSHSYRLSLSGQPVKNRLGAEAPATVMPVTGADNGLRLQSLRGLAYDDPLWEGFLDQLTYRELVLLPQVGMAETMTVSGEVIPEALLAASFDTELAYEAGKLAADQCLTLGKYYLTGLQTGTEDVCLGSGILAARLKGVREKGIVPVVNAGSLPETIAEQEAREQYLRAYQEALRTGISGIVADARVYPILQEEWAFSGIRLAPGANTDLATELHKAFTNRDDPAFVAKCREDSHRILYNLVNSAAINGAGENTQLRPPAVSWQLWVYAAAALCWVLHIVMAIFWTVGRYRWKTGKEYLDYRTMRNALKYKA